MGTYQCRRAVRAHRCSPSAGWRAAAAGRAPAPARTRWPRAAARRRTAPGLQAEPPPGTHTESHQNREASTTSLPTLPSQTIHETKQRLFCASTTPQAL